MEMEKPNVSVIKSVSRIFASNSKKLNCFAVFLPLKQRQCRFKSNVLIKYLRDYELNSLKHEHKRRRNFLWKIFHHPIHPILLFKLIHVISFLVFNFDASHRNN